MMGLCVCDHTCLVIGCLTCLPHLVVCVVQSLLLLLLLRAIQPSLAYVETGQMS